MGFPAGGFNIIIPVFSCDQSFVCSVKMAKVKDCPGFETFGADVKAEPFKLWLAQVGRERIEETIDPEQAIDRALETYQKKGYDTDWIHQRLLSIRVCNELTAEWQERGVQQGKEYITQKETADQGPP